MNTNKAVVLLTALCVTSSAFSNYVANVNYATLKKDYEALQSYYEELDSRFTEITTQPIVEEVQHTVEPIMYSRNAAPLYDIALSEELQQYTYDMCSYYEVEELYETMLAVMWQESNFDPTCISATNDYGLMQINECNHKYLIENLGIVDILDAYDNIESGIYLFSTLFYKYEDIDKTLMAYNMGPTSAANAWRRGHYTSSYSISVREKEQLILQKRKDI